MKVSIVIPVYNAEMSIRRCLDSIMAQTFSEWECILVDDGSPDNSGVICEEYAEKDSRFTVIHKYNDGAASARNTGIEYATGDYIIFIDSDDFVDPNHLQNLVNGIHDKSSVGIVFEGINQICADRNSRISFSKRTYVEEDFSTLFEDHKVNILGFSVCKLYDKNAIVNNHIKFPTGINFGEDLGFFLEYFKYCKWASFLDSCSYNYLIANGSQLHANYYSFESEHRCFEIITKLLAQNKLVHHLDIRSLSYANTWASGYLLRAMKTIYRPGKNKCNRSLRLEHLRTCSKSLSLIDHIETNSYLIYDRLFIMLLQYKLFNTLDFCLLVFFFLRYKLK